jgi:hypothetical protein
MQTRFLIPVALAAATAWAMPVWAGSLKFTAEIPAPPAELPVLKLSPQPVPAELMNRILAGSNADTRMTPLGETPFFHKNQIKVPDEVIGVVDGEHVRAWANKRTGDAAIYPTLSALKPIGQGRADTLAERSRETFGSTQFIAPDDTRFVIDKPQILNGSTLVREANGSTRAEKPTAPYLVYVAARRYVGELPVDGVGSRALLAISDSGSIEGLTRVWKTAKTVEKVRASYSTDQVRREITRQLALDAKTSDVAVDSVSLAYYDGNHDFLQPVYRYTARIRHPVPKGDPPTNDDFVVGYVPFARAFEALPSVGKADGPQPKPAVVKPKALPQTAAPAPKPNDPIVGRYVVRNDSSGWVNDANAFWGSLSSSWTGSLFTNSQYYWAEPRLFTNQKDWFINAMNLALIEVHGDWWLYSTLKNCCDLVNINGDIPNPGYGPSANGHLADWIIHSCEVVPAPEDTANWPDPWWRIFGGVRNVVGYRTIMYISDGAGGPYGSSLGNLAPVVSSWLSDVISLNAYSGHPTTAAHGGIVRPMGRPSTISMCGHDGDSVLSTSSLGRANCLTVWWFPD